MKVSTRGEYGVRAMFDLTLNYGTGPIPLKEIARRQLISETYLEQLMGALRKAGLVSSKRVRREAMSCPIPRTDHDWKINPSAGGPHNSLDVWIQTQATALTADSPSSACSATCGRNCRTA